MIFVKNNQEAWRKVVYFPCLVRSQHFYFDLFTVSLSNKIAAIRISYIFFPLVKLARLVSGFLRIPDSEATNRHKKHSVKHFDCTVG